MLWKREEIRSADPESRLWRGSGDLRKERARRIRRLSSSRLGYVRTYVESSNRDCWERSLLPEVNLGQGRRGWRSVGGWPEVLAEVWGRRRWSLVAGRGAQDCGWARAGGWARSGAAGRRNLGASLAVLGSGWSNRGGRER